MYNFTLVGEEKLPPDAALRAERILQSASERPVTDLLPVLDDLDRALESEGDVRGAVRSTGSSWAG